MRLPTGPSRPDAGLSAPPSAAGPPAPPAGVIGPRPAGVPRGRAILGGFLIAAAAVLVFTGVVSTRSHAVGYVVAARPLAAGTIIGPGDTATASIDLPGPTGSSAFRNSGVVIGRTLAVAVSPGQLIQSSMLAPAGGSATLRPVSITVDSASLAGLSSGNPVDVLASPSGGAGGTGGAGNPSGTPGTGGTGASAGTPGTSGAGPTGTSGAGASEVTVVLRGAALLSISRPNSGIAPISGSATVVTLGVATLQEAEMLVQAAQSGTVILVQAAPSDGVGPGPGPAG